MKTLRMKPPILLLMVLVSRVMSQETCPLPNASVSLSSSVKQSGRQFACPGERVTFTCKMTQTPILRIAAEGFIPPDEPVEYSVTDDVGSPGHTNPNDTFQPNLTNVQRELNQCEVANFTATLTANTTDETNNTVIECGEVLTSDQVQRETLTQSSLPSPPTRLKCSSMCTKYTNSTSQQLENGSVLVISTCQSTELVLSWEPASGNFDCDYYLVNILGNQTKVKITPFKVPNMPNGDYQVFVSTVSKCQETSRAVMINVPADENITHLVNTKDDANDHIIIGCITGGVVVLLIVSLVIVIVWWRKKKGKGINQQEMNAGGILKNISKAHTAQHDQ